MKVPFKTDPDCIYCKIIAREAPCHKIYEDESVVSFLSIDPMTDGHTLVVPKEHWSKVWKIENEETYQNLMSTTKKIASALDTTFTPLHVLELAEGIEIQHAHMHIIPSDLGYGELAAKHKTKEPDHSQLAKRAEQIRGNL